ncbi:hypothetical protein SHIRM173S_00348 [Streptomyces hirsutus]
MDSVIRPAGSAIRHSVYRMAAGGSSLPSEPKFPVAVHERHPHREGLGDDDERVVDRRVAVRVQLAHHLAHDTGALHVTALGPQPHLVHLVDDAAAHRLDGRPLLNPLMLPLLLLAVAPAGIGAILTARVDYEIHYANIADRNVRGMTRWWATTPKYGDEVRANGMTGYLLYWYRALSERVDKRTLAAAPRPAVGIPSPLKELSLFDTGLARLSTQFTALDTLAGAMSNFAHRSPVSILGSSALGKLSLLDTPAARLASMGVMGNGLASLRLSMPELNPFGDVMASAWNRVFDMPGLTGVGLLRGLPDGLLQPLRSITRLLESLGAPIVWLARAALDAYLHDDHDPMREFLYTHLRLRPPTEDHAQALAMALILREWENQVDIQDADAVRAVLRKCAQEGNDLDGDHQVMGHKIGHMEEGIDLLSPQPGPEALAIATAVPWAEHFDNRHVRYATGRLKDTEQQVARVWAENAPINWRQAPPLVGQDVAMGERVRRKLLRLGDDIAARAKAQIPRAN